MRGRDKGDVGLSGEVARGVLLILLRVKGDRGRRLYLLHGGHDRDRRQSRSAVRCGEGGEVTVGRKKKGWGQVGRRSRRSEASGSSGWGTGEICI